MRARTRTPVFFALIALVAGCSGFGSIAPGTSSDEVRSSRGAPTAVFKNPDGSETWEFSSGPYGTQTYMVTVANRAVREAHQVLGDEFFDKIKAGMSRDEVRRLIGAPAEIGAYDARDEEVWTWRYVDTKAMFFHVLFDHSVGTVRGTLKLEEPLIIDTNC